MSMTFPRLAPARRCRGERATKKVERATKEGAKKAGSQARSTARQARKVPGVTQAEGELKGAIASEQDLAIANYDSLNVDEIVGQAQRALPN